MKRILPVVFLWSSIFVGCHATPCQCPEVPSVDTQGVCGIEARPSAPERQTPIQVGGETIALPAPLPAHATLTESLQKRRSDRAYTDAMLSLEQLSGLLWSANGINRDDGKRTAPSARNRQSVSIFVAFQEGAYLYDFKNHQLQRVTTDDVRPNQLAPVELIFTSNHLAHAEARDFDAGLISGIDAGTVAQNVHLFCASEGLATAIRMMRNDPSELQKALKMEFNDLPLFNMAIGFVK